MNFHAEFNIKKLTPSIQHQHSLLLMGSCFTENIGEKLRRNKFSTLENPNGILFNPISVSEAIHSYIVDQRICSADIFKHNEVWHSWKHHSRFSGITEEDCIKKINAATEQAHSFLKNANYLLITVGSAWVYTLTNLATNAKEGSIAANNHKVPANWFTRRLLTFNETYEAIHGMLEELLAFNPHIQLIFTISPVRHLREGMVDNNRSKALLIQAVHQIVDSFSQAYYFPAYELVVDDLRDYRFYAEDLVHPNYQASQYVWEKFIHACMNDETRSLLDVITEINLAYQHKPFNPSTEQHQRFLASYYSKTKILQEAYSFLDFGNELNYFATNHH